MIAAFWTALSFAKTWWKAIVGVIVVAPLIFFLGQCRGEKVGQLRMENAIARANVETLKQKARADTLAANQRLTDTIAVSRQEEALRDAISQTPDSAPDATRISLGCARLRAAHVALPEACGRQNQ